jgi:exosortase/archaeosortase family protein
MSETPQHSEETHAERHESRRRIVGFVGVFVSTMLILLTAYRYAMPTPANDWYLFQVARDTSWVLGRIGHSSIMERRSVRDMTPRQVRATLAAWRAGRDAATAEEIAAAPDGPLSAWEKWAYRARDARKREEAFKNEAQENRKRANSAGGPSVFFVLKPGISSEIDELQGRADGISEDQKLDAAEKDRQKAPVQARLEELRRIQQAIYKGERPESDDKTRSFAFAVVSECGAIEVMAIFLAAVLAFPALWWKRLVGIAAGLPLMYLVNVFRLSVLGVIGALDQDGKWFKFAHEYVWQAVYIVFVVAVWLAWVEYIVRRKAEE